MRTAGLTMYEQYFGIAGPPFQLSPDPYFFFHSKQHSAALSALRSAFAHELPFVVLSGEIGGGKTTVLQTWLAEVDARGIAVAQIANTQLDADDLMRAVAHSFDAHGPAAAGGTPEAELSTFFGSLNGRAALLVIDEAQNLGCDALRRLVVLAELAAERSAVLRICLAGQPALRVLLDDPSLHDLARRVQQSCHLGALSVEQTQAYVEHRLLKVGWAGMPSFDEEAFAQIHRSTGGIPRRINALCHRLMLSQYLDGTTRIDARAVRETAAAFEAEISGGLPIDVPRRAPLEPASVPATSTGALLLVASGRSDHVKALPLLQAMALRGDLPPAVLVSLARYSAWHPDHDPHTLAGIAQQPILLGEGAERPIEAIGARFRHLLEACKPRAVVVFDGDALSQRCASIAHELDAPLVHVGTDAQGFDELNALQSPRAVIGHLAGLRFSCQSRPQDNDPDRPSVQVGSPLVDAIALAEQSPGRSQATVTPCAFVDAGRGYAVAVLKEPHANGESQSFEEILALLREVSLDLPIVWPTRRPAPGGGAAGANERIARIDELGHAAFIGLMGDATCVLSLSLGPRHASQLDRGGWLPVVQVDSNSERATRAVWQTMFNLSPPVTSPALWDGHAATRIAEHLAAWL